MGLGGQIKTGAWDPEEDDLLYYWQSKVGNKWSEVAKHIPGRTGQQCAQRWRHKVNPNIRRDKWTEDEDAKLIELVKTFGVGRWAEIARNCDGRTDQQCMGRWRRHLDPAIRRDSWSPEEDAKLRQLHGQYGTSWSRISKNLKGRTSQQCRARWHQINNTRSKSCGSGGAGTPAAAAAGSGGGRQLAGRKASTTKRKTSRRRQDSSCSEDEEDEEEDFYDDEDELLDGADEHAGSSGAHSGSGSQQGSQPAEPADEQQQQDYAAAVAAAAAAAGYGYGAAELQQPWVASLAAGMIHGALSNAADLSAQAAAEGYDVQQQRQQDSFSSQDDQAHSGDEADADADDAAEHDSRHGGRSRADMQAAPPVSRFKSLPSKLGPGTAATAAGRRLKHTASMPAHRRTPSGPCMSPGLWSGHQQQQLNGTWSPSRLLLSPQRPEHLGRGGRGPAVVCADVGRDVNDEEAAGAETLLEMASLLRQESCELQPAQLPLPAYTPPKRPAGDRLGDDLPDGFSPSPYKRARSSRLFADEEDDVDLKPADNGRSVSQRRGARQQQQQQHHSRLAGDDGLFGDGPTPQASPAAAHGHHRRNGSIRHYRVPTNKAAAAAEDGDEGLGAAAAAAGDACGLFGDRDYPGPHGFRGSGFGLHPEQGDEAGRPSNASSLTQMRGADAMAAAAAVAAAVFMSPPPPVRGSRLGVPGSATTTPNRRNAQHNALGILGSPMFERMVGCATPPSGGRTQPSAATLAALQSPQPSRVPEPFWTPFTGLFQDALFSRGTSATPDLPSGGKARLPRGLFSPAQRSGGSASGGKVAARRGMLHGGDVSSPVGTSAPDTDDGNQMGSQPSGDSAERPSGAATDAETGPSPAAACGVVPPVGHVHHRVVRRLDQHEAWGATRASPSKPPLAGDSSVKREALAGSGTGFSLFSPVKKQRVPLFNETSSIKVGATPSKPDVQDAEQLLPIAPLKHNLPEQAGSSLQQQQQGSSPDRPAAAAASSLLHRRSPLGSKPRDKPAASSAAQQLSPAATAAAAAAEQQVQQRRHGIGHRPQQQQQQQHAAEGESFRHQDDQQHLVDAEQRAHADGAGTEAAEGQGQQQHPAGAGAEEGQGVSGSPGLMERAGSINHQPVAYGEAPDTPVNAHMDTADNTSCSGTPNTPAAMRADATGGAGHLASPSEYVTPPQHRLRASRPLAPLHKDCLIAAATRSLADGLVAQQARHEQQQASASAAASRAAGAAAGAAAAADEDSPGQCSGDSSRILSCERLMDSPLEAAGMTHSPSQWHQGMVAMLRSLQQTPLQPKGLAGAQGGAVGGTAGDTPGAVGAAASSPATSAPGSGMGIKVCSRALRRLQDELERGSAATAAAAAALLAKQQQQQQRHVKTEQRVSHQQQQQQQQQQQAGLKDGDAQVPFSAGLSMAPAMSAAAAAGASCSTPMMLPLFTMPATAPGSSRLPAKGGPGAAAVRNSTTPLALAPQCSSGVASVSLTPAVVTMHTPAESTAASTVTPRMPAIAWPVQQRSDGGLVVSAPMTAGPAAAAAGAAPYATSGALVQLTPAASSTKAAPAGTGATPFPPAAGAVAGVQQWPQVVNIQPLTMLATACNAAVAAGHAAALQSVLALQPSPAPSTGGAAAAGPAAAGGGLGQMRAAGVTTGSTAGSSLRDSSHAVRSRLHALIDSV